MVPLACWPGRARLELVAGLQPLQHEDAVYIGLGAVRRALHADDGTFSLNFWITPDAANRNPDTGGLTVYREMPPADWELVDYNADQERIQVFVDQHGDSRVTIPYRQNRGVIFTSRLFHGTDQPDFDTGYANHRINITMLFGDASKF